MHFVETCVQPTGKTIYLVHEFPKAPPQHMKHTQFSPRANVEGPKPDVGAKPAGPSLDGIGNGPPPKLIRHQLAVRMFLDPSPVVVGTVCCAWSHKTCTLQK